MTNSLKTRLGLKPVKTETLHLNTFGEKGYRKQRCDVVALNLKMKTNDLIGISALNYPVICSPLPVKVNIREYPHLHGLQMADSSKDDQPIDLLIGSDYYWDFVEGDAIRGQSGPTAIDSKFGWLLSGPISSTTRSSSKVVSNLVVSGFHTIPHDIVNEDDEMLNTLKQFWETETIGIKESTIGVSSTITHNELARPKVSHDGQHYEVGLPWKENCMPPSDNYGLSVSRLRSLHNNLRRKPALLKEYDGIIHKQCKSGIIERVPDEVPTEEIKEIHYLPHHAVVRKDRETSKVRIV